MISKKIPRKHTELQPPALLEFRLKFYKEKSHHSQLQYELFGHLVATEFGLVGGLEKRRTMAMGEQIVDQVLHPQTHARAPVPSKFRIWRANLIGQKAG